MLISDALAHDHFVEIAGNPVPEGAQLVWFVGASGRRLRGCVIPAQARPARGSVIVCPGRTEFIEKYFEVAGDLIARGFAVLILDWPGQGLSDRLLEDREKGHIDSFQTFMGALANGLGEMQDRLPRPHVSLAHSMGGAIALAALSDGLVEVDAAAFSAPMWGLKARFFGIRYLVWAMRVMGRSGDYARQPGPPERFETNIVTHDARRWRIQRDLVDAAPDLAIGPVTWGWLGASLEIVRNFARSSRLEALDIPVLVATAREEMLVDNETHASICARLPDCEHLHVDGARHEILMETDDIRALFWAGFDRLLKRTGI